MFGGVNMQVQLIKSLFKPYKIHKKHFIDFFDDKVKRNFFKHRFYFECSKSLDESCMNHECKFNFLKSHENEFYLDLMQEIKNEKQQME